MSDKLLPAGRAWESIHMRCDGDINELLRSVLFGIIDKLHERDAGTSWFYLRYWEGGPHVRLRLALRPADRDETLTLVKERAGAWLVKHDPGYIAPEKVYDEIARHLLSREGEDRNVLGWQPHGHVWEQKYVPEVAKYGEGQSLLAFERHFEESSTLAARVLRQNPSETQVLSLATLLVLAGWTHEDIGPFARPRAELVDRWESSTLLDRRTPPRADNMLLQKLLNRARSGTDPWCEVWKSSLARLHGRLKAADVPPSRWTSGADVCHHLLCNRLGLTLEQEVTVRRIAWNLVAADASADAERAS